MATTSKCFSLIRGKVMRVTKLDGCGAPIPSSVGSVTTDGFITVGLTANTDTGTAISVTNAAGKVCISDTPCPVFTGYTVEIALCGVNPALIQLLTGQPSVVDPSGNITGFKMNSKIDACDSGFALELWSQVPAEACEAGQSAAYGYLLIPFLKGGVLGDFTVGNDAVNFTVSNANSKDGSGWGVGPYNVLPGQNDTPGPLWDPIDSGDHLFVSLTDVAPPDEACDPVAVGNKATGATAGKPGSFTPANSYPPYNLAGMTGVTASPSTAWTSGQYVTTESGDDVHFTGTAWAAGVA